MIAVRLLVRLGAAAALLAATLVLGGEPSSAAELSAPCAYMNEPGFDDVYGSAGAKGAFNAGETVTASAGTPASGPQTVSLYVDNVLVASGTTPVSLTHTFSVTSSPGTLVVWTHATSVAVPWQVSCSAGTGGLSAGCAQANASIEDAKYDYGVINKPFNAGETVTVSSSTTGNDGSGYAPTIVLVVDGKDVDTDSRPGTVSYTFPASKTSSVSWSSNQLGGTLWDVRCTAGPALPASQYSVADLSLNEGDGGVNTPKIAKFTITRTGDLSTPGSIAVHTESGTSGNRAIQDKDFKKRDTILQFPAGVATARLEVKIIGDLIDEPTERFRVVIDKPVGGTVTDHLGIGTIVDDD